MKIKKSDAAIIISKDCKMSVSIPWQPDHDEVFENTSYITLLASVLHPKNKDIFDMLDARMRADARNLVEFDA